jgi:hypothetical protein
VQGTTAAWLTVIGWPATVSVAVRDVVPPFGATVIVAEPEPVPETGLTLAQVTPLDAVQLQPLPAVMFTMLDPPASPAGTAVGDAE